MDEKVALHKCMALCSRTEYAAADLKQKLEKWQLDAEEQTRIIDWLYAENFLNDVRFAQAYVKDKFRFNHWGKVKINFMLKQKGIATVDIKEALAAIDAAEYYQCIVDELQKKHAKKQEEDPYKQKAKLVRFLASRGFEPELIYKAYAEVVGNL